MNRSEMNNNEYGFVISAAGPILEQLLTADGNLRDTVSRATQLVKEWKDTGGSIQPVPVNAGEAWFRKREEARMFHSLALLRIELFGGGLCCDMQAMESAIALARDAVERTRAAVWKSMPKMDEMLMIRSCFAGDTPCGASAPERGRPETAGFRSAIDYLFVMGHVLTAEALLAEAERVQQELDEIRTGNTFAVNDLKRLTEAFQHVPPTYDKFTLMLMEIVQLARGGQQRFNYALVSKSEQASMITRMSRQLFVDRYAKLLFALDRSCWRVIPDFEGLTIIIEPLR